MTLHLIFLNFLMVKKAQITYMVKLKREFLKIKPLRS